MMNHIKPIFKKFFLIVGTFTMPHSTHPAIEIKPLRLDQIAEVKHVIAEAAFDLWPDAQPTLAEFEQDLEKNREFSDIDDVQNVYAHNRGIFLVALDGQKIIGCGAIKKIDDDICELKRMWFLKEYRSQGWGTKMALELLDFARTQHYTYVRLDVYHPQIQVHAVRLYTKLGFYEIPAYNNSPAQLFMEKAL
jgi:putative acetyltransferase